MILAQPRGFCAGVERAISIVEEAIRIYGPPVFVRHEIVHNKRGVDELKNKGAIFVDEVSDIPDGGVTIFSAHGISEKVENQARLRSLPVIDATCPLVSKVHKEGQHHATKNRDVILIGHASHPEVEGTMGRIKGGVHLVTNIEDVKNLQVRDENKIAYVTQTTLSVDDTREIIAELKEKFPNIIGPDVRDICYATQNRQVAVRNIAGEVDVMLVVAGSETLGITAGASAPEELVTELIERLRSHFVVELQHADGVKENVQFRLPSEITDAQLDLASLRNRV